MANHIQKEFSEALRQCVSPVSHKEQNRKRKKQKKKKEENLR